MRIRYYWSSDHQPFATGENAGLEEVQRLLDQVVRLGFAIERRDTAGWSDDEAFHAYSLAATPAIVRHSREYSVRRVFGTNRRGGTFFGREVPALLVLPDEGETPLDVYPHRDGSGVATIRNFLRALLADPAGFLEVPSSGFSREGLRRLSEVKRRVFGDRVISGDSTELIRQAREGR